MKSFIFDTETTGLFKYFNKLHATPAQLKPYPWCIEFFGNTVEDSGDVLGEVEFWAKPGVSISDEITRITGITEADVADADPFAANADRVLAAIREADALVAHNLSYDKRILEVDFKRIGRYDEITDAMAGKRMICTVQETYSIKNHRMKLTDLYIHLFGEAFPNAHRARNDVNALTRCFLELRKREII